MFTYRIEAYTEIINLLAHSAYRDDQNVKQCIDRLKLAMANHEVDVATVVVNELTALLENPSFSKAFKAELNRYQDKLAQSNFATLSEHDLFVNPLRRIFESSIAIEMLRQPTPLMLAAVKHISINIIAILQDPNNAPERNKRVKKFLKYLTALTGPTPYEEAICMGAFSNGDPEPVTIARVINILNANNSSNFITILHIHYKFAQYLARELPLISAPTTAPIGKYKAMIADFVEQHHLTNEADYFAALNQPGEAGTRARSYISDTRIYKTDFFGYSQHKHSLNGNKGREYIQNSTYIKNRTNIMGLLSPELNSWNMITHFPFLDAHWVPDAKVQQPYYPSNFVKGALQYEALYISGPSGMASLFLSLMEHLGNFTNIEMKQAYLAAFSAYIVGGGFHSYSEVLVVAQHFLELIPGYLTPDRYLELDKIPPPQVGVFHQLLLHIDPVFQQRYHGER